MSESYISKLESGKLTVPADILESLQSYYQVFCNFQIDEADYQKLDFVINAIIKLNDISEHKAIDIYCEDNISYPYILLARYFQLYLNVDYTDEFKWIQKLLLKIQSLLEVDYRRLFLACYSNATLRRTNIFLQKETLHRILKISTQNDEITGIIYMYLVTSSGKKDDFFIGLHYFEQACKIFEKYNNHRRIVHSLVGQANVYSSMGYQHKAIGILEKCIEQCKGNEIGIAYIALSNLAYQYCLLYKYENALAYYFQADEYDRDNCSCFEIAWCYYHLKDNKNAMKYVQLSRDAKIYKKEYSLYNDWLEAMLNKKYSLKCEEILKRVERKYTKTMSILSRNFLSSLFIEYYTYHNQYDKALYYSLLVLNSQTIAMVDFDTLAKKNVSLLEGK